MTKQDKIIMKKILSLEDATNSELVEKFIELFGFEPNKTNTRNLRKRLAYKIQELHYGGISDKDKNILKNIADKDQVLSGGNSKGLSKVVLRGTRYEKLWKGNIYQVTVLDDGKFAYEGNVYKSLSAIAGIITGTHWNGKKFFGVK